MKKDKFETSDGQIIDLIPGWYERKTSWPYGIKNIQEFAEKCFDGTADAYPKGWAFFVNKVIMFSYFKEILKETGILREKWPMGLDIGTGPGIQPRLMKISGMCERAWGIDLLDRRDEFSDDKTVEYLDRINRSIHSPNAAKRQEIGNVVEFINCTLGNFYPLPPMTNLFDYDRPAELDEYFLGDFMAWEPPGGEKFDIITGMMCIEYFDAWELLKKACSLLNPGGVFFVIVDFWHEVSGGSMQLPMDAPWLHCRVSREDLIRYFEEVRPEDAEAAKKCIYFKNSHLTPFDYMDAAEKAGMKTMGARRSLINNKGNVTAINMNDGGLFDYFYDQIMPQAQKINPNFSPADACTQYLTMVFKKPEAA